MMFQVRFDDDEFSLIVQAPDAVVAVERFIENRKAAGFLELMEEEAEFQAETVAELCTVTELTELSPGCWAGLRDPRGMRG